MSIKINSMLDTTNNSWEVSLGGELDVSTADELKKELHKLVDEKNIDMRLNLENLDEKCAKLNYVPGSAIKKEVKAAMSNSFGFGGQNSSVVFTRYE